MAFVEIGHDDFDDLGVGVSVDGRAIPGSGSLEWGVTPDSSGDLQGDGSGNVDEGVSLICDAADGERHLFNAVKVKFTLRSLTDLRRVYASGHYGVNEGASHYYCNIAGNDGELDIVRRVGTGETVIGTYDVGTYSLGDTITFEVGPGYQKLYHNDTLRVSLTDLYHMGPFHAAVLAQFSTTQIDDVYIYEDTEQKPYEDFDLVGRDDNWDQQLAGTTDLDIDGRVWPADMGLAYIWKDIGGAGGFRTNSGYDFIGDGGSACAVRNPGDTDYTFFEKIRAEIHNSKAGAIRSIYLLENPGSWANRDGYQLNLFPPGNGSSGLYRLDNGVSTLIVGTQVVNWPVGSRVTMVWEPGSISILINDVEVMSSSDATHSEPMSPVFWLQDGNARAHAFSVYGPAAGVTGSAVDDVEFSETAEMFSFGKAAEDNLIFGDRPFSSSHQSDGVTFSDIAGLTWAKNVLDEVTFSDIVRRVFEVIVEDDLTFTDPITYVLAKFVFVTDDVTFADVAEETIEIAISISDGFVFTEVPDYFPIEGCETDFVPSPTIPDDPDSILYIYMWGPWDTLAYKIRMRRPEFGDLRRNRVNVVVHRTRGGGRRVYKRTPTYQSFSMRFSGMSRKKSLELEDFVANTAGEDIRLVDANGWTWRGNILSDPIDTVTSGYDQGEVRLEFEGSKVT